MADPVFFGIIHEGELFLERQWLYHKLVKKLEGEEIEVVLRKRKKVRSSQQNKYLHGVVIPLFAQHLGYDNLEMKEALKWRFLSVERQGRLPTVRSTAALSTAEMTEFIERVRQLAAEMGCDIPAPGEAE